MEYDQITEWVIRLAVLLFAITIHEYAHGRVAYFLADRFLNTDIVFTILHQPMRYLVGFSVVCGSAERVKRGGDQF
jgi:hypothetical protein